MKMYCFIYSTGESRFVLSQGGFFACFSRPMDHHTDYSRSYHSILLIISSPITLIRTSSLSVADNNVICRHPLSLQLLILTDQLQRKKVFIQLYFSMVNIFVFIFPFSWQGALSLSASGQGNSGFATKFKLVSNVQWVAESLSIQTLNIFSMATLTFLRNTVTCRNSCCTRAPFLIATSNMVQIQFLLISGYTALRCGLIAFWI